jgi:hypothetical protein
VIARQIQGKQLGGLTLEASADLFSDDPSPPAH